MNSNQIDQDEGFDPQDEQERPPSKSMLKRASHALQDLGEDLVAMPDARLASIEMPERLRDALDAWKTTRSFEGKRRQMQYIGKVLRLVDAEPLREAVASFKLGHARNALALHECEAWRVRLLDDEKQALTEWMAEYPDTDVQQLRNLIRQARKDAAAAPEQRNGRAYRDLFQFIKKLVEAQESQSSASSEPEADDEGEDA
jgi:ribosome-associated protein